MDKAEYYTSRLYRDIGMPIHIRTQEGHNVDTMQCWDGIMADLQKPMLFQGQDKGITVEYTGMLKRTTNWTEMT
eukprot:15297301-Heterocapsa_arctica.AAC.1